MSDGRHAQGTKRPLDDQLYGSGSRKRGAGAGTEPHASTIALGTPALVQNLRKAAQHNGKRATVGEFNPITGRYVVLLETGETLALQPTNIVVPEPSPGPPAAVPAAPAPAATAPAAEAPAAPAAEALAAPAAAALAREDPLPVASAGQTPSSRVLQLCNMVTAEELADPTEYADILSDVRSECVEVGGAVRSVAIPRLDDLARSALYENDDESPAVSVDAIGLIFVEFEEATSAVKARAALDGRTFGDNVVSVHHYPEADYARGVLSDVRAAQAAADEAEAADARRVGSVRFWNADKGFGFVAEDGAAGGDGTFVHARSLVTHASSSATVALKVGQRLSFTVARQDDGRLQATDVRTADGLPVDELEHQAAMAASVDTAQVSVHSDTIQGHKPSNEDRFTMDLTLGGSRRRFGKWIGVYDGHGGDECAIYLGAHLHRAVEAVWQGQPTPAAMTAAFVDGFARAEAGYMEQAERRKWLAGSTACVVLLHGWQPPPPLPSSGEGRQGSAAASAASAAGVEGSTPGGRCCTLWCANVGDSRAVLCRGGKARRLSEDHKPERRDERKRVEAAGGFVLNVGGIWRVTNHAGGMGGVESDEVSSLYLAVSRAFGDPQLKGVSASSKTGDSVVSAVPEVKSCALEGDDLFFLVGCDGVWDVLSDQEAIDIAAEHFPDGKAAAEAVGRAAYDKGSLDNITVSCCVFEWQRERGRGVLRARREKQKQIAEQEEEIDMFG